MKLKLSALTGPRGGITHAIQVIRSRGGRASLSYLRLVQTDPVAARVWRRKGLRVARRHASDHSYDFRPAIEIFEAGIAATEKAGDHGYLNGWTGYRRQRYGGCGHIVNYTVLRNGRVSADYHEFVGITPLPLP